MDTSYYSNSYKSSISNEDGSEKIMYRIDFNVNIEKLKHRIQKNLAHSFFDSINDIELEKHYYIYLYITKGNNILELESEFLEFEFIKYCYGKYLDEIHELLEDYNKHQAIKLIQTFLNDLTVMEKDVENRDLFLNYLAPSNILDKIYELTSIREAPVCEGCQIDAPGQMSHMGKNGCSI